MSQPPLDSCLLSPLVIGVTGHRDLLPEELPGLKRAVEAVFCELAGLYKDAPVVVLSALAEGADRLVAQVGLEVGARLIVALPLAKSDYEADFQHPGQPALSAQSQAEFAHLLKRAQSWLELPLLEGLTRQEVQAQGPARSRQYEAAGLYIARHSHLLLALWDGVDARKTGGTSEIVRLRLSGLPAPARPCDSKLAPQDTGPVWHLVARRVSNPKPAASPLSLRKLYPACEGCEQLAACPWQEPQAILQCPQLERPEPAPLREARERMLQFNRDARELFPRLAQSLQQSQEGLLPELKAGALDADLLAFRRRYALADGLALHFQRRRRSLWRQLCLLGVLGVLFLSASDNLAQQAGFKALLLLSYLLVVVGYGFRLLARGEGGSSSSGIRGHHLDYRALAEGLRVQFFWRLAGQSQEVADHYLRKQRSELEWLRGSLRAWNLPQPPSPAPASPPLAQRLEWVRLHWLDEQAGYFHRAQKRNQRLLHRLHSGSKAGFAGALALTCLLLGLHALQTLGRLPESSNWELAAHAGEVLVALALALFGALEVYADKMAFSEEVKQYQLMERLFCRAQQLLQPLAQPQAQPPAQDARLTLLFELGRDALTENGDWVLLHRERPMEMRL